MANYQHDVREKVLFALTWGGLSERQVVAEVRRFLSGTVVPPTMGAVPNAAQQAVQQRW